MCFSEKISRFNVPYSYSYLFLDLHLQMKISYQIGWQRNYSSPMCDENNLNSQISSDDLVCLKGCHSWYPGLALDYYCEDYNVAENWSFGGHQTQFNFTGNYAIVASSGCCWVEPFSTDWFVVTVNNLNRRNDTGKINSTPKTTSTPVLKLSENCNHTIYLPVSDPDNDIVRCRWGRGYEECGYVCNKFPHADLNGDSCIINYEAKYGTGLHVAAIVIEDFLPYSDTPLSTVSFQFPVEVYSSDEECVEPPQFIPPTFTSDSCIAIPPNEDFSTRLIARSGRAGANITEIITVSPEGLTKSPIYYSAELEAFYVDISWQPKEDQFNQTFSFCYLAVDSSGIVGERICIHLMAGVRPPSIKDFTVEMNADKYEIDLEFDQMVQYPHSNAYITFKEYETGSVLYQINVLKSAELSFHRSHHLSIIPDFTFPELIKVSVELDRASVVGQGGCNPGNEAIENRDTLTFRTLDITSPTATLINGPSRTNANVTFEWTVSEPAQGICSLDLLESVNCSEGVFRAENLAEGNHVLFIQLTDESDNTANITHIFYVDLTPPVTTFVNSPRDISNKDNYNFVFSCNEPVSYCIFYCDFHTPSASTTNYTICTGNSFSTPRLENEHEYILSVYAVDSVKNIGNPVTHRWKVDLMPPVITVNDTSVECSAYVEENIELANVSDNLDQNPVLTYDDERSRCDIKRTWEATDVAGNKATLEQQITILFIPSIVLLPSMSVPCSSTSDNILIPPNTASAPNLCRRPLTLSREDQPNRPTCPGQINRTWTLSDSCTGEVLRANQIITIYDTCPANACGQNYSQPHGICSLGMCLCHQPWYGETCNVIIYKPQIKPVEPQTLLEYQDYEVSLTLLQGTDPIAWNLESSPDRTQFQFSTQKLSLKRAQAGNMTFIISAKNQAGEDEIAIKAVVNPTYVATLNSLSQTQFPRNELITLSGTVSHQSNSPVREILQGRVPVTIYVENVSFGWSRTLKTFADQNGNFSVVYNPGFSVYGQFAASARHPSQTMGSPQVEWGILGMKIPQRSLSLHGETNGPYHHIFSNITFLINDGPSDLHSVQALPIQRQIVDYGINVNVTFGDGEKILTTLASGEQIPLNIELATSGPVQARFPIELETQEGVKVTVTLNLNVRQILPIFHIDPSRIQTSIARGRQRSLDIAITNMGKISAENMELSLPDSPLFSVSSFSVGTNDVGSAISLGSQETAEASILITIPEDQPLGVLTGNFYVTSQTANSEIPFSVHVTSDSYMNLTIVVEDEYTYFADGSPLVSDATITLTNTRQNLRLVKSTSENNGSATFDNLLEDVYDILVEAPEHRGVRNTIVTSISTPTIKIFLEREAVKVSWSVVSTEVEDIYDITLEVDYQVNVPMPVVTLTPSEIDLEDYKLGLEEMIEFNMTNHGLIRTDGIDLQLPTDHPSLEFTILSDVPESIEAKQVLIILVQVSQKARAVRATQCSLFYASLDYSFTCGEIQVRTVIVLLKENFDSSGCSGGGGGIGGGGYWFGGGGGGGGSSSLIIHSYSSITFDFCDKCLRALMSCVDFTKLFGKLFDKVFGRKKKSRNSNSNNSKRRKKRQTGGIVSTGSKPAGGGSSFSIDDFLNIYDCAVEVQNIENNILQGLGFADCVVDNYVPPYIACIDDVVIECVLNKLPKDHRFHPSNIGKREASQDAVGEMIGNFALTVSGFQNSVILLKEIFGDEIWLYRGNRTWVESVLSPVFQDGSELGHLVSSGELQSVRESIYPEGITWEDIQKLILRLNGTLTDWNNGILEPSHEHADVISNSIFEKALHTITASDELAKERGFASYIEAYNSDYDAVAESSGIKEEDGVCAIVKIQVKQRLTLTREGFIGTLDIENLEKKTLRNIKVEIIITDKSTLEVSTEKFSIGAPSVSGSLSGTEGNGTLPEGSSGTAEWLIIPYSEAAPTTPLPYDIGGRLSYSIDGSDVEFPFIPTSITVYPDPSLIVHYFWEKYVISDDPFTDEIEPTVPFSLGVMIKNEGFGTAYSMKITSSQPEIIENEKGLLISFKMISSMLGNEKITPSLAVDFEDIPPSVTKTARWWMTASLMGKFINYNATFENKNPLGDPKLSLIDDLQIHELIQNVLIPRDDDILDFLVNDDDDVYSLPDKIYSSRDMSYVNVTLGEVTGMSTQVNDEVIQVQVDTETNETGWHYFVIEDGRLDSFPTGSSQGFRIKQDRVIRSSPEMLPSENAWVSVDVTNKDRKKSLNILAYSDSGTKTSYTVEICGSCTASNFSTATPVENTTSHIPDTTTTNTTYSLTPDTTTPSESTSHSSSIDTTTPLESTTYSSSHDTTTPLESTTYSSSHDTTTPSESTTYSSSHDTTTSSESTTYSSSHDTTTPLESTTYSSSHDTTTPSESTTYSSSHDTTTPLESTTYSSSHDTTTPSESTTYSSSHDTTTPLESTTYSSSHDTTTPLESTTYSSSHDTTTPSESTTYSS